MPYAWREQALVASSVTISERNTRAARVDDLESPSGNRLNALKGDMKGGTAFA